MIERLSVYIILSILEENDPKEEYLAHIKIVSQYLYSNYLNFIDSLIVKLTHYNGGGGVLSTEIHLNLHRNSLIS